MATAAGRSVPSTLQSALSERYLRYSRAMSVTRMQDGRTEPMVAAMAPGIPAILMPTKVAELMMMGPGVICEMVMRSVNSAMVSQ